VAEQVPITLKCISDPAEHEIVATGTGRGPSRGDALSAARSDADTQLSLGVVCEGTDCDPTVSEIEPVYDSSKPIYEPWGSGFECKVGRTKKVKASCTKKTAMAPAQDGSEHLATGPRVGRSRRA